MTAAPGPSTAARDSSDRRDPVSEDDRTTAVVSIERALAALVGTMRASMRRRAQILDPELPPLGFAMVSTLVDRGPTHSGAIAEQLGLDRSVVSRQARQLEDLGLLDRRIDDADRRAVVFAASPLADRRVAEIRAQDRAALVDVILSWPAGDAEQLAELLTRLVEPGTHRA